MIIPIPSNKRRFNIHLTITATQPIEIGISLFDPTKPFSDYFRRKVSFQSPSFRRNDGFERDITIPVPISPEFLKLKIYNKATGDSDGIKIRSFDFEPIPAAELWASPEQHRFMEFAIGFAQKAGYAPTGFYNSPDNEFLIQYLPVIKNSQGQELVTPARIHRQMPRVQLSQKLIKRFTIPVRVAILSHEGCHYFLNTRIEKEADLCGIKYYLDYGFPSIEAVYAATKVFMQNPDNVGSVHVERTKDIIEFIEDYKAKEANQPNLT